MIQPRPLTRFQVPRGARADGQGQGVTFLIKPFGHVRLTYQIRVLTFQAIDRGEKLLIVVGKETTLSRDLRSFVEAHKGSISLQRSDLA